MAIDERLLDCDTQPEIEENFNRILSMQESKAGPNVWDIKATLWGDDDRLIGVRVLSRQSEYPAAAMAELFEGYYAIMPVSNVRKDQNVNCGGYIYLDDELSVYTLPDGYVTDTITIAAEIGAGISFTVDLNTNNVIYNHNPLEN